MLSLHTNAASLSTQNSLASTNKALSSSMTKLGTGFRVNSAMDDAAGLQIATRLNAQSMGMKVAQKNTQNGISMLQTAEGALNEVTNMLLRMKDLATEKSNATTSTDDKTALEAEMTALSTEITSIMANTTFGGEKLLTGGKLAAAMDFQTGADKVACPSSVPASLTSNLLGASLFSCTTLPSLTSMEYRLLRSPSPLPVRSSVKPVALANTASPSANMRTLPAVFWSRAHAPITKASLTARHQISSTPAALNASACAT